LADGALLLAGGAAADAVPALEAAWSAMGSTRAVLEDGELLLMRAIVCEQLALALAATDQLERVDVVLGECLAPPPQPSAQYTVGPPPVYWLPRLHELRWRLLGQQSGDFLAITSLSRLLAFADPDDTVAQSMQRWRAARSAVGKSQGVFRPY
jgi:hypothetical protein